MRLAAKELMLAGEGMGWDRNGRFSSYGFSKEQPMIDNNSGDYAVLFVDDEEKARKYFSKAVGGRYAVLTAGDVAEAEEILETKGHQVAVVISDQRMPGENGVELLKRVRSRHPGIVRLLTTAYSDLNDAIEAINRGEIYRYIQKPWHVDSLQAEVKGAFDYFHLQRERDLLLAEKLSARQRMTGVERITQLLVFARTFTGLSHADHALKDFLEYLHMLPGTWESDGVGRVDQWELTKWESKRITDYTAEVTKRLLQRLDHPERFDDAVDVSQLIEMNDSIATECACKLSIEQNNGASSLDPWQTNRRLLEVLLQSVYALFSEVPGAAEHLQLSIFPSQSANGEALVNLAFRAANSVWPTDRHLISGSALTPVHPLYQQALACNLAAAHHGGHCSLRYDAQELTVILRLPVSAGGEEPALQPLGWDWLPDMLACYEPSIDEFYEDL